MPRDRFRFRKADHLKGNADFRRVFARRRSVSNEWLIVYGCENGLERLRLGMSVSRKAGNAVRRNRLRRLYREAFRLCRSRMPVGLDLVLIPRGQTDPSLDALKKTLPVLVQNLARTIFRKQE